MAARRVLLRGLKSQVDYLNSTFVPAVLAVSPAYTRDADPTIDPLVAELGQEFNNIADGMSRQVDEIHRQLARDHTGQWLDQVRAGLGIDISALIDPDLEQDLRLWSSNTAQLIKKATGDLAADVARETYAALSTGQTQAQLAKTLQLKYTEALHGKHVGRTAETRKATQRAKRIAYQRMRTQPGFEGTGRPGKYWNRYEIIARDQSTTLRAHLDRVRQAEAGVEKYKWKDSDDTRVRRTHRSRDHQIYSWTHEHSDGHPGEPVLCRCIALAVIE